jgi:hypothetical protein
MFRLFKLGAASGVIGLGLQAAGMFGGGGGSQTQYVQDNRAKYEADMIGFQSTLDNQRWAEQILNGQIQAQNSMDDYSFQLQNLQLNKEMEAADQLVQQQYNSALFQNSLSRMTSEVNRYSQLTQYNQAKINADYQDAVTQRKLSLAQAGNQADLANSTANNKIAQANLDLQGTSNRSKNVLDKRALDLQGNALTDANTQLNYKEQGLGLSDMGINQQASEAGRTLDTQETKGNVSANMMEATANSNRGDAMREMLRNVARSEQEFSVYEALLGSQGRREGTQSGQIQQDRLNQVNPARQQVNDQYAQQIGQAGLTRSMNQTEVNQGRRDLQSKVMLQKQGINNQRGELGLARNDLTRQQAGLTNARQAQEIQFQMSESQRELQNLGLQQQQRMDVFSKSLLPDMQYLGEGLMSQWQRANTNYSLDVQDQVNNFGYETGNSISDLQNEATLAGSQNAYDQLISNYALQGNSAIASYLANMGNTQMQKAAGLNQIGGNTFSQLGQYGGYSQPITGSTGGKSSFNAGALSGLFDSAMGLMSSGGGNTQQVWANPYAFEGGGNTVSSGSYTGNTMNGKINW